MYESILRKMLFQIDPETAHNAAMGAISKGLVQAPSFYDERLEQTLFGHKFANPVGLAAGFDKNAVAIPYWRGLGFGFAEIGTVTYHAQSGNPKPRMFRFPEEKSLVNRLGFNNQGATAISERVAASIGLAGIPIGVNLGKSKVTPLGDAPGDYAESYRLFTQATKDIAYFVINVSSPNTPNLRNLQEKGALEAIIRAIRDAGPAYPLFVKVAPDLHEADLGDVLEVAVEQKLQGIITTNTTIRHTHGRGGLSGAPLKERAVEVLKFYSARAPKDLILIGVGGIFGAADLYERIAAGAHLCQMYTGWIYGGPGLLPRILEGLAERMHRAGFESLAELRGSL